MTTLALLAAALLAAVHIITPSLHFLEGTPRSIWLSVAGGVSVAYVFVHLLPERAEGQEIIRQSGGAAGFAERHVYLIALLEQFRVRRAHTQRLRNSFYTLLG